MLLKKDINANPFEVTILSLKFILKQIVSMLVTMKIILQVLSRYNFFKCSYLYL